MTSVNFQERFRNKVSTIGKYGELEVNQTRAVFKTSSSSINSNPIAMSGNAIINSGVMSPSSQLPPKPPLDPFARKISIKNHLSSAGSQGQNQAMPTQSEFNDAYFTHNSIYSEQPRVQYTIDNGQQVYQNYYQMPYQQYQMVPTAGSDTNTYVPNMGTSYVPNMGSQGFSLQVMQNQGFNPQIGNIYGHYPTYIASQSPFQNYGTGIGYRKPSAMSASPPTMPGGEQRNLASRQSHQSYAQSEIITTKKPRNINYRPYNLKDYNNIKPGKYFELGGLGAYNIGTEEWEKRKKLQDRRSEYARNVKMLGLSNSPIRKPKIQFPTNNSPRVSARDRALHYAKLIQRPIKPTVEIPESTNEHTPVDKLQKLQSQHEEFAEKINKIKAALQQKFNIKRRISI